MLGDQNKSDVSSLNTRSNGVIKIVVDVVFVRRLVETLADAGIRKTDAKGLVRR